MFFQQYPLQHVEDDKENTEIIDMVCIELIYLWSICEVGKVYAKRLHHQTDWIQ